MKTPNLAKNCFNSDMYILPMCRINTAVKK